jgi:transposase
MRRTMCWRGGDSPLRLWLGRWAGRQQTSDDVRFLPRRIDQSDSTLKERILPGTFARPACGRRCCRQVACAGLMPLGQRPPGRRGGLIKVIWHDGQGACLFSKKLERGRFIWPTPADGAVTISPAQMGYLGIDWRAPQKTWRPELAG